MNHIYSKVILSGEHSVLRGGLSVVAPFRKHHLSYFFQDSDEFQLSLHDNVKPYEILIHGTLDRALEILNKERSDLKVSIKIENLVPLGEGLGGSAALCVFVAKLLSYQKWIEEKEIFNFSKELENIFHGESSGVDIAGCVSSQVQSYVRGENPKPICSDLKTYLYLSPTGESGSTEECIDKVLSLKSKNAGAFFELDESMDQASRDVLEGLMASDREAFFRGLNSASIVFKEWGLYTSKMQTLESILRETGAQSVKPTGSGLGGFMLSAWSSPQELEALPEGSLELSL